MELVPVVENRLQTSLIIHPGSSSRLARDDLRYPDVSCIQFKPVRIKEGPSYLSLSALKEVVYYTTIQAFQIGVSFINL